MTRSRLEALQWFALFAGPLAWATEHVVGYGASEAACQRGAAVTGLQIALASVVGVIVLAAEASAMVVFRATAGVGKNDPGPAGRLHFFAQAALVGNLLFFVIVVLDGVATVVQLPCRQG